MPAHVSPIPEGAVQVTPYITVGKGQGSKAIEFYSKVFGAKQLVRLNDPKGKVGHAELEIGNGRVMIADEFPGMGSSGPDKYGGSPVLMHLYVDDVDGVVKRAVAAGAKLDRPVETHFYGDRGGKLIDPFGHIWYVATHVEDVAPDEIERRAQKMYSQQPSMPS